MGVYVARPTATFRPLRDARRRSATLRRMNRTKRGRWPERSGTLRRQPPAPPTHKGADMSMTNDPPLYTETRRDLGHDELGRCLREDCDVEGDHLHGLDGLVYPR